MATPDCEFFVMCGGCSYQHLDYSLQLENKKKHLANATDFDDVKVFSDNEYGYRNRMDFIFYHGGLGFRRKNRPLEIIDVKKCSIANEKLNILLKEIRKSFKGIDSFDNNKKRGTYKYAVIRTPTHDSSISFVLNEDSTKLGDAVDKIKEFAKTTTANNIIITYVTKDVDQSISEEYYAVKGEETLKETFLGKEFSYHIQGFFQNNTVMAEKMQTYVNNLLKKYDTKESYLLDLYCGVGTFGIINANLFKETMMIESYAGSIEIAQKNIEKNNIKNAKAIVLDAKHLKKVELKKPLYLITDPPRSGMDPKTIDEINRLNPEIIIYISCNVEQLKKDIPKFGQYQIKSAALFDLFPQTPHSEAIIELVRKN